MSSSPAAASTTPTSTRTWKDYFQWFIYFLRVFTILTLVMNLVAYAVVIKIGVTSDSNDVLQKTFIVLQNVGFGLFVICLIIAEFQPVWFVKRVMILHYWGGRGFGQAFMGVQLIASAANAGAAVAHDTGSNSKAMQTFAEVSGWILFSIGILMIIMSALCLRDIVALKADQQLEAALLSEKSSSTSVVIQHQASSSSSTKVSQAEVYGNDAKDKLQKEVENYQTLVQNMSTAMGISYVVASSKFGGKSGAQAAENFQREMKQKEEQFKKSASAVGNNVKQEFNKAVSESNNGGGSSSSSSAYSPKEETPSIITMPTGSSSTNNDGDEPVGRRRRAQMDDDELEKMYYGK